MPQDLDGSYHGRAGTVLFNNVECSVLIWECKVGDYKNRPAVFLDQNNRVLQMVTLTIDVTHIEVEHLPIPCDDRLLLFGEPDIKGILMLEYAKFYEKVNAGSPTYCFDQLRPIAGPHYQRVNLKATAQVVCTGLPSVAPES